MKRTHHAYIVTGTSSGIGKALAEALVQRGDIVYGIARSDPPLSLASDQYVHVRYDLSDTQRIEEFFEPVVQQLGQARLELICLVNNAAMVEPLLPIERCETEQITANIHTSLIAPMILTSQFIKMTKNWNIARKVVNISSASAVYASPDMSVYSAAKSGLDMFTRCVGREQVQQGTNPVEILSIHPGMVDTSIQQLARSKSREDFAMADYFQSAYSHGDLLSTSELVTHLLRILDSNYAPGSVLQYTDE